MRPGQNNNKRMRGNRPNNNRRGPNPLTRSYESNGPDVKIRGNAHHIAEKYLQLARDAHTGGDPVAAENYLQHAEHYFRLIATAQAAQLAAQGRPPGEPEPEEEEDDDSGVLDRFASPAERAPPFNPQPQPQPFAPPQQPQQGGGYGYNNDRQPYEERQQHNDRNGYQPRNDRPQQNRIDNRPPRPQFDNGQRDNRGPREFRPYRDNQQRDLPQRDLPQRELQQRELIPPREAPQPVVDVPAASLPSFITAAPRVPTPAEALDAPQPVFEALAPAPAAEPVSAPVEAAPVAAAPAAPAPEAPGAEDAQPEARSPRGRRRRLRSPYGFHAGDEAPPPAPGDGPTSE